MLGSNWAADYSVGRSACVTEARAEDHAPSSNVFAWPKPSFMVIGITPSRLDELSLLFLRDA